MKKNRHDSLSLQYGVLDAQHCDVRTAYFINALCKENLSIQEIALIGSIMEPFFASCEQQPERLYLVDALKALSGLSTHGSKPRVGSRRRNDILRRLEQTLGLISPR